MQGDSFPQTMSSLCSSLVFYLHGYEWIVSYAWQTFPGFAVSTFDVILQIKWMSQPQQRGYLFCFPLSRMYLLESLPQIWFLEMESIVMTVGNVSIHLLRDVIPKISTEGFLMKFQSFNRSRGTKRKSKWQRRGNRRKRHEKRQKQSQQENKGRGRWLFFTFYFFFWEEIVVQNLSRFSHIKGSSFDSCLKGIRISWVASFETHLTDEI